MHTMTSEKLENHRYLLLTHPITTLLSNRHIHCLPNPVNSPSLIPGIGSFTSSLLPNPYSSSSFLDLLQLVFLAPVHIYSPHTWLLASFPKCSSNYITPCLKIISRNKPYSALNLKTHTPPHPKPPAVLN